MLDDRCTFIFVNYVKALRVCVCLSQIVSNSDLKTKDCSKFFIRLLDGPSGVSLQIGCFFIQSLPMKPK